MRQNPGISIHALLAESDDKILLLKRCRPIFLSTLSLRRATRRGVLCYLDNIDFYPRSPCGERRHLLRYPYPGQQFLSTLSLRRATGGMSERLIGSVISIHALLAESDHFSSFDVYLSCIFLSTLSLRRATVVSAFRGGVDRFLSTLSLRRATKAQTLKIAPLSNFYPRSPCGERQSRAVSR